MKNAVAYLQLLRTYCSARAIYAFRIAAPTFSSAVHGVGGGGSVFEPSYPMGYTYWLPC